MNEVGATDAVSIVAADYANPVHARALITLLYAYPREPAGVVNHCPGLRSRTWCVNSTVEPGSPAPRLRRNADARERSNRQWNYSPKYLGIR